MYTNNKTEKDHSIMLLFFLALLLLMQVIRHVIGISIPLSFFTLIFAVAVFLLSRAESIVLVAAMVPFCNNLPMNEILLCFIAMIIIKESFNSGRICIRQQYFELLAIWVVIEIINNLRIGIIPNINIIYWLVYLLAIYFMIDTEIDEVNRKRIGKYYCLGTCAFVLLLSFVTIRSYGISSFLAGSIRLGRTDDVSSLFSSNPNSVALLCVLATSICLHLIESKAIRMWYGIPIILISLVGGVVSQSRAFIIGEITLLVIYILARGTDRRRTFWMKLAVIAVILCGVYFVTKQYPDILNAVLRRFQEDDITNGRVSITQGYFKASLADPIGVVFGYGLSSYMQALLGIAGVQNSAHSMILEVYLSWGIVGFVIVTSWIISLIRIRKSNCFNYGNNSGSMIPLIILLVMLQSSRMFRTLNPILLLAIAIIFSQGVKDTKREFEA